MWTAAAGSIAGSPTVANGVVYVTTEAGSLQAYDEAGVTNCSGVPKVCAPLWSWTSPPGEAVTTTPAVANGRIYLTTNNPKNLLVFDATGQVSCSGSPKTCVPLWSADLGPGPWIAQAPSPAVANGVVYITGSTGLNSVFLFAFDANGQTNCSGSPKVCAPLWLGGNPASTTGGLTVYPITSSPAVANGVVYLGADGIYAWDAAGVQNCSGTPKVCAPLLHAATATSVFNSPSISDGRVIYSSSDIFTSDGTLHVLGPP